VALSSNTGLVATLGAKESPQAPAIHLTYDDQGDITAVTAGSGLTGGGTTGAVSLALGNASVTAAHLAPASVGAAAFAAGAVGAAHVQDRAVTASKFAVGAVTTAKLAAGSVNTAQIGNGAVGTAQIAAAAVGVAHIAANTVDAPQIADAYRTISLPAQGFNRHYNSTTKVPDEGGLLWAPTYKGSLVKWVLARPSDFVGEGLVEMTLYCQVPTNNASTGKLAFEFAHLTLNAGEQEIMPSSTVFQSQTTVPANSSGTFVKVNGYTGAHQLTKEIWEFQFTRDAGRAGALDTYPQNIRVVSASLTYPATR
ncbi:MAG: hypothetical protein M3Y08_08205, partial [Fibrobacterota bacterium]|nr:hypothetical protein [Fibrobacterota bacterium]